MPTNPKRGLGRGFDALIPTDIIETEFDPTARRTAEGKVATEAIQQVSPDQIDPNPHQPRQMFDQAALEQLADSIKAHGILQPLVVTKSADRYELIAGERRLRAAKLVGFDSVPVIVRSFNDQQKLELALIENLQRQDLNPIETAAAYRKLIDQFNLTQDEIGHRVGRDQSTIANSIRLLGLPLEAKRALAAGKISESLGRTILSVPGTEKQLAFLDLMIKHGWNLRQAEQYARDLKADKVDQKRALERVSNTNELTEDLGDYLGTKVSLQRTAKGGRLLIEFYSDEELERIYQSIKPAQ